MIFRRRDGSLYRIRPTVGNRLWEGRRGQIGTTIPGRTVDYGWRRNVFRVTRTELARSPNRDNDFEPTTLPTSLPRRFPRLTPRDVAAAYLLPNPPRISLILLRRVRDAVFGPLVRDGLYKRPKTTVDRPTRGVHPAERTEQSTEERPRDFRIAFAFGGDAVFSTRSLRKRPAVNFVRLFIACTTVSDGRCRATFFTPIAFQSRPNFSVFSHSGLSFRVFKYVFLSSILSRFGARFTSTRSLDRKRFANILT